MEKTLYKRLKEVELLKENLNKTLDSFSTYLDNLDRVFFRGLSRFSEIYNDTKGPNDIVNVIQKRIFEEYEDNEILKVALDGVQSIESIIDELTKPFEGWRRYFPYKKDEKYNERIEELKKVIPGVDFKKGLFSFNDYVVPFGVISSTGIGIIYTTMNLIKMSINKLGNDPNISLNASDFLNKFMIYFGVPFSLAISAIVSSNFIVSKKKVQSIKEKAQYLDNKIKELF